MLLKGQLTVFVHEYMNKCVCVCVCVCFLLFTARCMYSNDSQAALYRRWNVTTWPWVIIFAYPFNFYQLIFLQGCTSLVFTWVEFLNLNYINYLYRLLIT